MEIKNTIETTLKLKSLSGVKMTTPPAISINAVKPINIPESIPKSYINKTKAMINKTQAKS